MFNMSAEKPYVTTKDLSEALERGAGIKKDFRGKSLQEIVDIMIDYQKQYLVDMFETNDFYAVIDKIHEDKTLTPKIKDDVNKKLTEIVRLMRTSFNLWETEQTFKYGSQLIKFGLQKTTSGKNVNTDIWLSEQFKTGRAFGIFVQDQIFFKGGDEGGGNFAGADMEDIGVELKNYMDVSSHGLRAGDISIGIMKDNTGTTVDALYNKLKEQENKTNAAIIELYIKMRNLLLIVPENTRVFHFNAIVLYIELLIQRVIDQIENRQKALDDTTESEKLLNSPGISITDSNVLVEPDKVTVQKGYTIHYSNLTREWRSGQWREPKDYYARWNVAFKNIENLYAKRIDVLNVISGVGSGEDAARFITILKSKSLPIINFDNFGTGLPLIELGK